MADAKAEQKQEHTDLQLLEEDDEFEEFAKEGGSVPTLFPVNHEWLHSTLG